MKLHQSERNNLAAAAVVWYPTFNCPDITRTFNVEQEVTKIKIKKKESLSLVTHKKYFKLLTVDYRY